MTTYEERIDALSEKYTGKSKRLDDGALTTFTAALAEKVDKSYAIYDREHNIAPTLTRDEMRSLRRRDAMREHYARMDPKPAKVDRLGIEGYTVTTEGVRVKDAHFDPTTRRNYLPRVFKVICSDGVLRCRLVEPARLESIPCAPRPMTREDLDMWTEDKAAHGYAIEVTDPADMLEIERLQDEAREECDDMTPFTWNQPMGRYHPLNRADMPRLKPLEIDYLGVLSPYKIWRTPTSFWESPIERKYWIGRIYLHNAAGAGGHHTTNLADEIGRFFGISRFTVMTYAKFAEESDFKSHDCFIKGTRIRIKRRVVLSGDWVLKASPVTKRIVPWTTCDGMRPLHMWMFAGPSDLGYMARSQLWRLISREDSEEDS